MLVYTGGDVKEMTSKVDADILETSAQLTPGDRKTVVEFFRAL
jgi:hypothetical protein